MAGCNSTIRTDENRNPLGNDDIQISTNDDDIRDWDEEVECFTTIASVGY
jgi:hypothetical protein